MVEGMPLQVPVLSSRCRSDTEAAIFLTHQYACFHCILRRTGTALYGCVIAMMA